jgi:hypothetical protein
MAKRPAIALAAVALAAVFSSAGGDARIPSEAEGLAHAHDLPLAPRWERLADGPALAVHAAAFDSASSSLWVMGGSQASGPSDSVVHRLDLAAGSAGDWSAVPVDDLTPNRLAWSSAVFDPQPGRVVVYGGLSEGRASGATFFLDAADAQRPAWSRPSLPGQPAARSHHAAVYDRHDDAMIVTGGRAGNQILADTQFLVLGPDPYWQPGPRGLAPRYMHAAAYDTRRHRLVVIGGTDRPEGGTPLEDVWLLDLQDGLDASAWRILRTSSGFPARYGHTATYDPGSDAIWVYGGTADGNSELTDLWQLNLQANPPSWGRVSASRAPGPLFGHAAAWDEVHGWWLVHGGYQARSPTGRTSALVPDVPPTPPPTAGPSPTATRTRRPTSTRTPVSQSTTPSPSSTGLPAITVTQPSTITPGDQHIFLPRAARHSGG